MKTPRRPKRIKPTRALVRIELTSAEMSPVVEVYHYDGECCRWWPTGWHCPWFCHGLGGSRCYLFNGAVFLMDTKRPAVCVEAELEE